MTAGIEEIIRMVYKIYRNRQNKDDCPCPEEEALACFCEGKLPNKESTDLQKHILICKRCAQIVSLYSSKLEREQKVPKFLINKAKNLIEKSAISNRLEIQLSIREKFIKIIKTNAKIIFDSEILPLPVLRARHKEESEKDLNLVKEFQKIKINVNLEKINEKQIRIKLLIYDKKKEMLLKGLRVALSKEAVELESRLAESGRIVFERLGFGQYFIHISRKEELLALLDLKFA